MVIPKGSIRVYDPQLGRDKFIMPHENCPHCGKPVARKAGLYRCATCRESFSPNASAPIERRSDTYSDNIIGQWSRPIDGRAIPIDRKIK